MRISDCSSYVCSSDLFVEPVEEILEISLGFAGEADYEARADRDVGGDGAPVLEALKHLGFVRRALHALEDAWARVLEGDVEIGREQPLRHQRDDRVDVRIGVDIVEIGRASCRERVCRYV